MFVRLLIWLRRVNRAVDVAILTAFVDSAGIDRSAVGEHFVELDRRRGDV